MMQIPGTRHPNKACSGQEPFQIEKSPALFVVGQTEIGTAVF